MRTAVPILDVILVFVVVGLALSPWPWLALIGGGLFFAVVAIVNDRREAPPPEEHPQ